MSGSFLEGSYADSQQFKQYIHSLLPNILLLSVVLKSKARCGPKIAGSATSLFTIVEMNVLLVFHDIDFDIQYKNGTLFFLCFLLLEPFTK